MIAAVSGKSRSVQVQRIAQALRVLQSLQRDVKKWRERLRATERVLAALDGFEADNAWALDLPQELAGCYPDVEIETQRRTELLERFRHEVLLCREGLLSRLREAGHECAGGSQAKRDVAALAIAVREICATDESAADLLCEAATCVGLSEDRFNAAAVSKARQRDQSPVRVRHRLEQEETRRALYKD